MILSAEQGESGMVILGGTLGGHMQMSVLTGAWGNTKTKSTEHMCQSMMSAMTISKRAAPQETTGEPS